MISKGNGLGNNFQIMNEISMILTSKREKKERKERGRKRREEREEKRLNII